MMERTHKKWEHVDGPQGHEAIPTTMPHCGDPSNTYCDTCGRVIEHKSSLGKLAQQMVARGKRLLEGPFDYRNVEMLAPTEQDVIDLVEEARSEGYSDGYSDGIAYADRSRD